MLDRREFLRLLGVTTIAGLSASALEALGEAANIPVPGELLDLAPRPLVVAVGQPVIGCTLDDLTRALKRIYSERYFEAFLNEPCPFLELS